MTKDDKINYYATRSFRDMADWDYVSARMSLRAEFVYPSIWQSQQALEKYLKCILLLNRIPARNVRHDLLLALNRIENSAQVNLQLTPASKEFVQEVSWMGEYRYFEVSTFITNQYLVHLDRIVWELRRFCTLQKEPQKLLLEFGRTAPKYSIAGGVLEDIYLSEQTSARTALLWKNAFFGNRRRIILKLPQWWKASNAPLSVHPEIVEDLVDFIHFPEHLLPDHLKKALRQHREDKEENVS